MSTLSPAAHAVLQSAATQACLAEWREVNDPPCHPSDEGWNGCHLCIKRDLIAAALRAAADQIPYLPKNCSSYDVNVQDGREEVREKFLAIANELEAL